MIGFGDLMYCKFRSDNSPILYSPKRGYGVKKLNWRINFSWKSIFWYPRSGLSKIYQRKITWSRYAPSNSGGFAKCY